VLGAVALLACSRTPPSGDGFPAPPAAVVVAARGSGPPAAVAEEERSPEAATPSVPGAGRAAQATVQAVASPDPAAPPRRLGCIGRAAHVYAGRSRKAQLGTLRPGSSVALRAPEPEAGGGGCKSGRWYAIEPTGFVCDDPSVTRDLGSELFVALSSLGPDAARVLPFGYAYSTGAPMYGKLPTEAEQRRAESRYRPVAKLERPAHPGGHQELATGDAPEAAPPPPFAAGGRSLPLMPYQRDGLVRKTIREGNLLSFQGAVAGEGGRLFLMATNMTLVPADRVRVFRESAFKGLALGGEGPSAPLGWTRRHPGARFRREAGGALVDAGRPVPPRTAVMLTGNTVEQAGVTYHEIRGEELYVSAAEVSVVPAVTELPRGVDDGERWVEVSLSQGTLTLHEGTRAVYSTLSSPGAGGTTEARTRSIEALLAGAFSPLGLHRVSFKYRSAVMTPEDGPEPERTWIDDVPYIIYFRPPFALHGVYWHEDFGMPKSGGCINLAPADARHVFDWTEPRVPEGWAGASNLLPDQPGTKIYLHR
jgi:hypothetical protein